MSNTKRWKIEFSPVGDGHYNVEVRRSEGMTPDRFTTKIPPDTDDLVQQAQQEGGPTRSFRSDAAQLSPEARLFSAGDLPTLKEVGDRLLNCMFDVGNGTAGYEVLGVLKNEIAENEGLELQIDLSRAPELSSIPWESLYLKSTDSFLAISKTSNIVRRMDAQRQLPPPIDRPIRVLVVSANPKEDLNTGLEVGNIEKRINELIATGKDDFRIETVPNATRNQFREAVGDFRPHIIHYIGHSSFSDGEGHLYFESGEKGVSDPVTADELRFMLLNDRPWLVVLNSCESGITSQERPMAGVAQNLLGRLNIPFVVAMQQPISDDAAISFSQKLYAELTAGETVANAVTAGRSAIFTDADIRTKLEIITPALYTSGAADRLHFTETDEPASTSPVEAAAAAAATTAAAPLTGASIPEPQTQAPPPPPPPPPPPSEPVTRGAAAEEPAAKKDWVKTAGLVAMGMLAMLAIIIWAVESSDEHDGDDLDEMEVAAANGTLTNPVGAYVVYEGEELLEYVYADSEGNEYLGRDPLVGTWEIVDGAACFQFASPTTWGSCYERNLAMDGLYFVSKYDQTSLFALSPPPEEQKSAPYPGAYVVGVSDEEQRLLILSDEEDAEGRKIAYAAMTLDYGTWGVSEGQRCTTIAGVTECDEISADSGDAEFTFVRENEPNLTFVRLMN